MFVGHGVAVGFGVAAGVGVFVGSGVEVGNGVFVGRGVAVGIGPGIEVEVVKVSATFASTVASIAVSASRVPLTPASTVASIAVSASRVPLTPASTVAGTSAVGRDSVCWSGVDVCVAGAGNCCQAGDYQNNQDYNSHFLSPVPRQFSIVPLDIVALPGPGFSATVASTLALRMTRRKVLVPIAMGTVVSVR